MILNFSVYNLHIIRILKGVKMNNSVADILTKLENADNKSKSLLENELVNFGEKAVPELVKNLTRYRKRSWRCRNDFD